MFKLTTCTIDSILSASERRLLIDVIDIHVQGVEQAKILTTEDPTIDSAEQLLDLMAGYDDDLASLSKIRKLLNEPPALRQPRQN